jgi:hypothetical protein
MMAAMAAAVSAASTLRLEFGGMTSGEAGLGSVATGLPGAPVFIGGGEPLNGVDGRTSAGARAVALTRATGLAIAGAGADTAAIGALLTGALWRPTE